MTKAEADKLLGDKMWRLNNLYNIKTKDKKLLPLYMNLAQRDFLGKRGSWSFILKARQLGFTTLCLIDMLDDTIFSKNVASAILAHEQQKVVRLFEIVKRAFDGLPDEVKPRVSLDNRNELYFPDLDSKIYVTMDTRGETVNNLHVSELAFIKHAEERLAATLESVPIGGKVTFETTANGMAGYAYDEWVDEGSDFRKFFYNWMWDEGYTLPTTKTIEELQNEYAPLALQYGLIPDIALRFSLTPGQFAFYISKAKRHRQLVLQEYPTTDIEAFISSGRALFHANDLAKHVPMEPVERKWGELMVYEQPLKGFRYSIGVDTSEGLGGDNACIQVLNAHTGEQAAEYANPNIAPDQLADVALEIARYYNNALIVPEINSSGISFVDHIKGKYLNIYRREVLDRRTKEMTEALGWRTTGTSKPLLVNALEEAVREGDVNVNSRQCLHEMRTFVRTDESGKQGYGAEGSNHDDRVMALGLAYQGIRWLPKMAKPENLAQKKLREYIEKKNLSTQFGEEKATRMILDRRKRNYAIRGSTING
jgi:hypothetical protein